MQGSNVITNNALYKCNTTHTSALTFDSAEEANWDMVVGTSGAVKIKNWATSTQYKQYDVVMVNNNLYRCVSNHTSTTFSSDISNWELIYASIGNWQASTYYPVGVFVINDKKLYKCKTQHTSGSTFSDTNWDLIAGGGGAEINNWATSTQYKVGDLVIRENNLYRCKTAHTSSAFNTDIANWIKLDNIPDWASSKFYFVDDLVTYSNNVYKCVTAHTSVSTFDNSKWQILGMTVTAPIKVGEVGFVSWQYALMPDHLALDGSTISNFKATYPELYDFFNTNSVITNVLATYTANKALCYYDSTTDDATLPDFLNKTVWGGTTIDEKKAGLPNITGRLSSHIPPNAVNSGATYLGSNGNAGVISGASDPKYSWELNASRSNSIYGNSTTVQPPAIQLIPQIRYRQEVVEGTVEHYDNAPIGTIISFMGVNAPNEFLICDGSTYNINDYWELAEFIKSEFGSYNYFGGDGTTTFAVPDLRGEFLRGTGTNSHTNQGSGASVGVHQDGTASTEFMVYTDSSNKVIQIPCNATDSFGTSLNDSSINTKNGLLQISGTHVSASWAQGRNARYTSRPTNTSVLYCIKYTNSITMNPSNHYSTDEKRIGTWIDGSPLYQKTIVDTMPIVTTNGTRANKQIDISDLTISACISVDGVYYVPSQLEYIPINSAVNLTTNTRHTFCQVYRQNSSNSYVDTLFIASSDANSSGATAYITLKYTKV